MHQLANISQFEQLQATANAAMGYGGMGVFNGDFFPPVSPIAPSRRTDIQKRQQEEQKRKQNQKEKGDHSAFADAVQQTQSQLRPDQDAYNIEFEKLVSEVEKGADKEYELFEKMNEAAVFWDSQNKDELTSEQLANRNKCDALFDRVLNLPQANPR